MIDIVFKITENHEYKPITVLYRAAFDFSGRSADFRLFVVKIWFNRELLELFNGVCVY